MAELCLEISLLFRDKQAAPSRLGYFFTECFWWDFTSFCTAVPLAEGTAVPPANHNKNIMTDLNALIQNESDKYHTLIK